MRQDSQNIILSQVLDFQVVGNLIEIKTAEAQVRVLVFSDSIIQVRALALGRPFEDFSYAVVENPQLIDYQLVESENQYEIITKKIRLIIQKNPLRFRFFSSEGVLLNEDEPSFGISWQGTEVTNYKKLQSEERFIGLGAKNGSLDRRGNYYVHWNSDAFAYEVDTDPLYTTIPFFMGLVNQKVYGIFLDNTYKTHFNFGASNERLSFFKATDGELRYYFFHDDSVAKIIEHYTFLTGRIPMPPLWSLGFQQCRYSYYPEAEIINVAENFRIKHIPTDVLYLDIHYMERYKVFTWDYQRFPHPQAMVEKLKAMGFRLVLIFDPGVKVEKDYPQYEQGIENQYFVKYPDDTFYQGQVWPGWCHFPDFTQPEVREWWGKSYQSLTEIGISGFWNDMNEPAVWGKDFPDLVEFNYEGYGASYRKAHNVYGMQMARSTFEGTRQLLGNQRPFVLTRAGYAGVQRYAAVWTGDNVSKDENMLGEVRLLNSMGLSGLAFCGYDTGGFVGDVSAQVFNRWVALGAFAPFYRCHTTINSKDAEPWSFGEETEEIARNYIKLRYRLLPYIYSVFYEATQSGIPIQRSLAIEYTWDAKIYQENYENEYLFGPNLLICAVLGEQLIHKIYLPRGEWYDLFNDTLHKGGQEIYFEAYKDKLPVFVKAGGILLLQSTIYHTGEQPSETLELHLYEGEQDSEFVYYEDDGESYDFEQGQFYKRAIKYIANDNTLLFSQLAGNMPSKFKKIRIYLHGFRLTDAQRQSGIYQFTDYRFVEPISNFDPWDKGIDLSKTIQNLPYLEVELLAEVFEVIVA
jgi:alpha-glucosidase